LIFTDDNIYDQATHSAVLQIMLNHMAASCWNLALMQYCYEKYILTKQINNSIYLSKGHIDMLSMLLMDNLGGHHSSDRMVVGFTTKCAISAYYH